MRNFQTANSTYVWTNTKIGTETISRTSHSVSIGLAWPEAATGNQSIASAKATPSAEAMAPMIRYCASGKRACGRSGVGPVALSASSPANPWRRILCDALVRREAGRQQPYLEGGGVEPVVRPQGAALRREP